VATTNKQETTRIHKDMKHKKHGQHGNPFLNWVLGKSKAQHGCCLGLTLGWALTFMVFFLFVFVFVCFFWFWFLVLVCLHFVHEHQGCVAKQLFGFRMIISSKFLHIVNPKHGVGVQENFPFPIKFGIPFDIGS